MSFSVKTAESFCLIAFIDTLMIYPTPGNNATLKIDFMKMKLCAQSFSNSGSEMIHVRGLLSLRESIQVYLTKLKKL